MLRFQFFLFLLWPWMASAGPIFRWLSPSLESPEPTSLPLLPDIERREPGGITAITPVAAPTQLPFTPVEPIVLCPFLDY